MVTTVVPYTLVHLLQLCAQVKVTLGCCTVFANLLSQGLMNLSGSKKVKFWGLEPTFLRGLKVNIILIL